jgi:hypothetical protein
MGMAHVGRPSKVDKVRQHLDEAKRLRACAEELTTSDLKRRLLLRAEEIEASADKDTD